jgi:putative hydrolase of the HAD superfamily
MNAIIFDLDNCLAAADEPGPQLLAPVFDAVRAANGGALTPVALDDAFRECWIHAFDWIAERHRFTEPMRTAGWRAFRDIEVREPMHGYGDLDLLPSIRDVRFLVTSGFRRLQESKVRALGIGSHFAEVIVDAVDEPNRRGKERIFADLVRDYQLSRDEVVVVGDNIESELAAANRLALHSVQIVRPGIVPASGVSARVQNLFELQEWLRSSLP